MPPVARTPATFVDIARRDPDERLEIVHGAIVQKASPTFEHGDAQSGLAAVLRRRFHRGGPGGPGPGGWWLATEVDVQYGPHELFRHDLVGWRRDRHPQRPSGRPVTARPDWACEVVSESNAKRDLQDKPLVLARAGVPHYWTVDPEEKILVVHRLEATGYLVLLSAGRDETVRAEPFEAVPLKIAVLLGEEDDD